MNNTPPVADWLLEFGSAEMVITYSPNSPYYTDLEKARKGEIPWYDVISQQGFNFGRTDPELDPKGYYTIITANLANIYYNDSSIKERILGEDKKLRIIKKKALDDLSKKINKAEERAKEIAEINLSVWMNNKIQINENNMI